MTLEIKGHDHLIQKDTIRNIIKFCDTVAGEDGSGETKEAIQELGDLAKYIVEQQSNSNAVE